MLAVEPAGTGASLNVDGQPVVSGGILALLGTPLHQTTDGLANFAHLHLTAGPHTSVTAAPIPAFPPFIEASTGLVQTGWPVTPQQRQAITQRSRPSPSPQRGRLCLHGRHRGRRPAYPRPAGRADQLIEA